MEGRTRFEQDTCQRLLTEAARYACLAYHIGSGRKQVTDVPLAGSNRLVRVTLEIVDGPTASFETGLPPRSQGPCR